jgi:hypothetical protein
MNKKTELLYFYFFEKGKKRKIYIHNANSYELNQLKSELHKFPEEQQKKYRKAIEIQKKFLNESYENKKNYYIQKELENKKKAQNFIINLKQTVFELYNKKKSQNNFILKTIIQEL